MSNVIPMDQAAAAKAEKRAAEEAERARKEAIKAQIKKKTLELHRYQEKLREITEVNATLLSSNGDILLRNEIRRLDGEIAGLMKDLEEAAKR